MVRRGISVIHTVISDVWYSLVVKELKATGKFETMGINADEDEHSIEMHLPYVRKVFEG